MREFFDLNDPEAQKAPQHVLKKAGAERKRLLKITWDEADGYPEHAWGYVQWSPRPFTQLQGCDGTTDENVHLIAKIFCSQLGLDYPALWEQAYAWRDPQEPSPGDWLRGDLNDEPWASIRTETVIPELSEQALRNLLHDLNDINNRSIRTVLEEQFERLGYDMSGGEW